MNIFLCSLVCSGLSKACSKKKKKKKTTGQTANEGRMGDKSKEKKKKRRRHGPKWQEIFRSNIKCLCDKPSLMRCHLLLETGTLCLDQMIRGCEVFPFASLHHKTIKIQGHIMSSGLKQTSPLRSPKTWWDDMSH